MHQGRVEALLPSAAAAAVKMMVGALKLRAVDEDYKLPMSFNSTYWDRYSVRFVLHRRTIFLCFPHTLYSMGVLGGGGYLFAA